MSDNSSEILEISYECDVKSVNWLVNEWMFSGLFPNFIFLLKLSFVTGTYLFSVKENLAL